MEKFEGNCGCSFEAKSAFIATWDSVTSFCDGFNFFPFGRNDMDESFNATLAKQTAMINASDVGGRTSLPENTFQVAFVTNGARKSFVVFHYDNLEWDFCFARNRVGQVLHLDSIVPSLRIDR